MKRSLAAGLAALSLAGCAAYSPRRLPERTNLPASAAEVPLDPAALPFRDLATHVFDPADGLDMDEVAMLAVANNPKLREARDALGVARAQAFAAGLLPDPQLGFSVDHPTNGAAGSTNAFNLNPGFDVSALLLRSSRKGAAGAEARRVSLDLLWQEWQVVSRARLLFTRLTAQAAVLQALQASRKLLADRYQRTRQALAQGNATIDVASAELAGLQKVERQINDAERARLKDHAGLNQLLGLLPTAPVSLAGAPHAAPIDAAAVRAQLEPRLGRRPDLQALRAGYRSGEEKLRGAVLAQFPALNVGLTRARDTSGLYTVGFGLTLSLPVFNASRGNIAIEDATRRKLYDEYQHRLDAAYGEIEVALENLPLLEEQLRRTRAGAAELEDVAGRAATAYGAGNLAAADYVRLQAALLDKRIEAINLEEALMEQRIALETLVGPALPAHRNGAGKP